MENARETAEACGGLKYVSPWARAPIWTKTSGLISMHSPAKAPRFTSTCRPVQMRPTACRHFRKRDFKVQLLDETLAPASPAPPPTFPVDADGQKNPLLRGNRRCGRHDPPPPAGFFWRKTTFPECEQYV